MKIYWKRNKLLQIGNWSIAAVSLNISKWKNCAHFLKDINANNFKLRGKHVSQKVLDWFQRPFWPYGPMIREKSYRNRVANSGHRLPTSDRGLVRPSQIIARMPRKVSSPMSPNPPLPLQSPIKCWTPRRSENFEIKM